jgi:hypothetical protein
VIGLTDRKSLEDVLCVAVVAALCVLYVLHVAERVGFEVVVFRLCVLKVLSVTKRVGFDVVVFRLCVLKVLSVSKRVALDLCLFFGSLAVLILHGVLLSHYGVPINVHKTV